MLTIAHKIEERWFLTCAPEFQRGELPSVILRVAFGKGLPLFREII